MSTVEQKEMNFGDAIRLALTEEMRRDPSVFLIGEDIGRGGGVFKVTAGLIDEFGPERVIDSPISEAAITGIGVGAALTGMRPVVEIMFGDFITLAMDQIVNQAAKFCYMSGGQASVPMVVRTTMGAGRSSAAQHSQSLHCWLAHVPGLKVIIPSTPYDAKGLLKSAIRDKNPVVFYEDKMMYKLTGPVPLDDYTIPLGRADVKRQGDDVTIIATSSMVHVASNAASLLATEGISVEIVDPRCLKPLDIQTILTSVIKTGKALVVDEGYQSYGITAEIASLISDLAFDDLDAPVQRLGAMDVPVPFSPVLEFQTIPTEEMIADIVKRKLMGRSPM